MLCSKDICSKLAYFYFAVDVVEQFCAHLHIFDSIFSMVILFLRIVLTCGNIFILPLFEGD